MEIGGDKQNFGRGWKRKRLVFVRTLLKPNIPRQPLIGNPQHYNGGRCETQAKPSIIGAKYRIGFTLAEILITLSIIGVVAALTIPSLVSKNQEKETVVQLKKAYNILSNAFNLAQAEYGEASSWGWISSDSLIGAKNGMDKMAPFLNIVKRCEKTKGCYPKNVMYKNYLGKDVKIYDNGTTISSAILADGMCFFIWSAANDQNDDSIRASVSVDVNGHKPPNVLGKDTFVFHITGNKFMPGGSGTDSAGCAQIGDNAGSTCSAWVLTQENFNYPPKNIP